MALLRGGRGVSLNPALDVANEIRLHVFGSARALWRPTRPGYPAMQSFRPACLAPRTAQRAPSRNVPIVRTMMARSRSIERRLR